MAVWGLELAAELGAWKLWDRREGMGGDQQIHGRRSGQSLSFATKTVA